MLNWMKNFIIIVYRIAWWVYSCIQNCIFQYYFGMRYVEILAPPLVKGWTAPVNTDPEQSWSLLEKLLSTSYSDLETQVQVLGANCPSPSQAPTTSRTGSATVATWQPCTRATRRRHADLDTVTVSCNTIITPPPPTHTQRLPLLLKGGAGV
jgi:hypothetical protein